jgi:hypothetical protein
MTTISVLTCSCKVPDILCSVWNKFVFSQQIFIRIYKKIGCTKIFPMFDPSLYRRPCRTTDMKKLMVLIEKYLTVSCSCILQSSTSSIENRPMTLLFLTLVAMKIHSSFKNLTTCSLIEVIMRLKETCCFPPCKNRPRYPEDAGSYFVSNITTGYTKAIRRLPEDSNIRNSFLKRRHLNYFVFLIT